MEDIANVFKALSDPLRLSQKIKKQSSQAMVEKDKIIKKMLDKMAKRLIPLELSEKVAFLQAYPPPLVKINKAKAAKTLG